MLFHRLIMLTVAGCLLVSLAWADATQPDDGYTTLRDAAKRGDLEALNAALAQGVPVDPADPGNTSALMNAASQGHAAVVARLIDAGAKIAPGTEIGVDLDADRERGFRVTKDGITLVTPDMLGQQLHFTR